ncbi:hypothetical protein [Cohnella sp. GbtcB17]|uniref:hypothetical protein n=1 Tax=Cohnella sp. GbtcB17 TaxID=2824762 RepID=UPI001C2F27A5|nr:hypothetical protein [Cohnella sp. GbtcB17]
MVVFSLIFLTKLHLDYSLGDRLFEVLGVSPWTSKEQSGLHITALLGFVLLIIGVVGTVRHYRSKYPKILSRIIIGCFAFTFIYPILIEKIMFLAKHNASGINSIDVKDGRCNFQTVETVVKANCTFTFYNYGKEKSIVVKPIMKNNDADIEIEERTVSISPHSRVNLGTQFEGKQRNGTGFSGTLNQISIEIMVNGNRKRFDE